MSRRHGSWVDGRRVGILRIEIPKEKQTRAEVKRIPVATEGVQNLVFFSVRFAARWLAQLNECDETATSQNGLDKTQTTIIPERRPPVPQGTIERKLFISSEQLLPRRVRT